MSNQIGVKKVEATVTRGVRYRARYFAGYGLRGQRIYPSRTFNTELEATEWYLSRKADAKVNPHAETAFPDRWAEISFNSIRNSAIKRKIIFEITLEQYKELIARADGRCTITGIKFEFQKTNSKSRRRPFTPSLDRIDPNKSYSLENCRLICAALNYALGDWGMESLMRIARRLIARERDVMIKERQHANRAFQTPHARQFAQ